MSMNCDTSTLPRMKERRKNEGLIKYIGEFICFAFLVLGCTLSISVVGSIDLLGCIFIHHTSFEILATDKMMNYEICFPCISYHCSNLLSFFSERNDNPRPFSEPSRRINIASATG